MLITVEVSESDLVEMGCSDIQHLEQAMLEDLDIWKSVGFDIFFMLEDEL